MRLGRRAIAQAIASTIPGADPTRVTVTITEHLPADAAGPETAHTWTGSPESLAVHITATRPAPPP